MGSLSWLLLGRASPHLDRARTEAQRISDMEMNDISGLIIDRAIHIHRALGPGLLESAYEACLAAEFDHLSIKYVRQRPLPLTYRGTEVDCAYRIDFLVEDCVVLELKSVKQFDTIDQAQLLSYSYRKLQ